MGVFRAFIILQLVYMSTCKDRLEVIYEWKELDYDFPTPEERQQAIDSKSFIPKNNIPLGLEVYGDRLFLTVTRWRPGVPASLNYIDLNDKSTKTPKLKPYPNWEAHSFKSGRPEILSPYRIRADECGRLWVFDSGRKSHQDDTPYLYPPSFLIYDLNTDKMIRRYEFPVDQVNVDESEFSNIAVEVIDCHENTYAYAADSGASGMVVYSWARNDSYRINHPYFKYDPVASEIGVTINGVGASSEWNDGLLGMSLSSPNADKSSTLYFHPIPSYNEFYISTEYLHDHTLLENNLDAFKLLGSRGPKSQSLTAFFHKKTGVIFYTAISLNAVTCWSSNKEYNTENQGLIFMNNETMVFPCDLKVDLDDNVWVLSNRLPIWMEAELDLNDINFRVFSAPVSEAISHTVCDVTPSEDVKEII